MLPLFGRATAQKYQLQANWISHQPPGIPLILTQPSESYEVLPLSSDAEDPEKIEYIAVRVLVDHAIAQIET